MQFVKESIFVSAIRSFFNAFLAMIGVLIGLVILFAIGMSFSGSNPIATSSDNVTMEILPDAEGNTTPLLDPAPVILQIDFTGIIGLEDTTSEMIDTYLRMSQHSMLLKSGRVKGILLNISTPGGIAPESSQIYHSIMRYKEKYKIPVYTFARSICASAGYMIACSSDKIYAAPSCIVGSVGVKTVPSFNYSGLMEKYGVKAMEVSQGKNKIKYPAFTPLNDDNKSSYQDIINITESLYAQFVDIVVTARKEKGITKNRLVNDIGAQVYIAETGAKIGFVDDITSFKEQVIEDLVKAAQINEGTKYQVIRLKRKHSPIQTLLMSTCQMWTMRAKEWIYGLKHEGIFDGQPLYICDPADRSV